MKNFWNLENKIILFFITLSAFSIYVSTPSKVNRQVASIDLSAEKCGQAIVDINTSGKKVKEFSAQLKSSITEAFKVCLGQYIRIKTISPAGNEEEGVAFFETIFSRLDMPYKRFYVDNIHGIGGDKRVNFIATLPADRSSNYDWSSKQDKKSIILLNHMDVVDAIASQWEDPKLTWSGKVAPSKEHPNEEYIWGRGALDMKGIAITQLINMWILKQMDSKIKRDIHFLAVADEEAAGAGAIGAIQKMEEGEELHALSSASLVLNEGGGGIKDTPSDGWDLFLLATEEKGGAWLKLTQNDPIKMLSDLFKSKLIMIDSVIKKNDKKITGHGCKVVKIVTPKAKVNVVASKVIVDFECNEGFQTEFLFKSIFKHNFKTVKTSAVQNGVSTSLTIETSSASHGASGINESAMDALVLGLYYLDILSIRKKKKLPSYFDYIQTAATKSLINGLRKSNVILAIVSRLSFIPFFRTLILKEVENSFGLDGLFRTSCQFSAMNFNKDNSGVTEALVDCRLLHTALRNKDSKDHPKDFIEQLYKKIKNPELKIDLISGWNVSYSPVNNKDFKMIQRTLNAISRKREGKKKAKSVASAYLFPAGTDSTWFRNPYSAGVDFIETIPSYGFFPLYMTEDLLASYHGSNERFPVAEVPGTVYRYLLVLDKLSRRSDLKIIRKAKTQFQKLTNRKPKKVKTQSTEDTFNSIKEEYQEQIQITPAFE